MTGFQNRVDAEREVLRVVNKSRFSSVKLCGLSALAIRQWEASLHDSVRRVVVPRLILISDKVMRMANRSAESFESISSEDSREFARMLADFESLVSSGELG